MRPGARKPGGESDRLGPPPRSDGSLLALVDVSVGPPVYQVRRGEVWRLGRHVLAVADVICDWGIWKPYLTGAALFMPYPGMYVPLAEVAATTPLVLVQPDTYLAGHLLDKYAAVHGGQGIRLLRDPDQL